MHPYLGERLLADRRWTLEDQARRHRLAKQDTRSDLKVASSVGHWWDRIWPVVAFGQRDGSRRLASPV